MQGHLRSGGGRWIVGGGSAVDIPCRRCGSRGRREAINFAEGQSERPPRGAADGVDQSQHAKDLQQGGPEAQLVAAAEAAERDKEPEGIVKVEVDQQEVDLLAPRPGKR